jgi:nucleoside-diphosphate kinase
MVKVEKEFATKHYGYNDEWFENVGKKLKEFYKEQCFDPGEEINKMSNMDIGKMVQGWNVEYLTEGPVVAMILESPGAVSIVRKMVGSTFPQSAQPGTIRGDFSFDSPFLSNVKRRSVYNLIHASGTPEEAELEIQLWFKNDEINSYKRVEEYLMVGE